MSDGLRIVTLDEVKMHMRVDGTAHDEELLMYAKSAEAAALRYMERDVESLICEYGCVPADVKHACLCRIGSSYKYREDVTDRVMYRVPQVWDSLLLPYCHNI